MVQEVHGSGDETVREEQRPRRVKLVAVKVVTVQQETALVEWADADDRRRVYVPVAAVVDGKVDRQDLDAGAQYGVRWEERVLLTTPETVAKRLRQLGIWTLADLRANAPLVKQEAKLFDVGALIRACEQEA